MNFDLAIGGGLATLLVLIALASIRRKILRKATTEESAKEIRLDPTEATSGEKAASEGSHNSILYWTAPNGTEQRLPVSVPEPIPDEFSLLLPVAFQSGRRVWIGQQWRESIPSVARQCVKEGESFRVRLERQHMDRRRTRRATTSGTGTLEWRAEDGTKVEATVAVCDVGDDGLGMNTPKPVPVHQVVRLSGQDIECVGSVHSCAEAGDQYRVAMQFVEEPYVAGARTKISEDPSPLRLSAQST